MGLWNGSKLVFRRFRFVSSRFRVCVWKCGIEGKREVGGDGGLYACFYLVIC